MNNLFVRHNKSFEYGTPEGTFSFLFLSCTHKLLALLKIIKTRLNDLLCRSNKLNILFKQDSNLFKRLIMSFNKLLILFKQDNNSLKWLISNVV